MLNIQNSLIVYLWPRTLYDLFHLLSTERVHHLFVSLVSSLRRTWEQYHVKKDAFPSSWRIHSSELSAELGHNLPLGNAGLQHLS